MRETTTVVKGKLIIIGKFFNSFSHILQAFIWEILYLLDSALNDSPSK
jgi:hypothetical protein